MGNVSERKEDIGHGQAQQNNPGCCIGAFLVSIIIMIVGRSYLKFRSGWVDVITDPSIDYLVMDNLGGIWFTEYGYGTRSIGSIDCEKIEVPLNAGERTVQGVIFDEVNS